MLILKNQTQEQVSECKLSLIRCKLQNTPTILFINLLPDAFQLFSHLQCQHLIKNQDKGQATVHLMAVLLTGL
jgi:hypothetical protein